MTGVVIGGEGSPLGLSMPYRLRPETVDLTISCKAKGMVERSVVVDADALEVTEHFSW